MKGKVLVRMVPEPARVSKKWHFTRASNRNTCQAGLSPRYNETFSKACWTHHHSNMAPFAKIIDDQSIVPEKIEPRFPIN